MMICFFIQQWQPVSLEKFRKGRANRGIHQKPQNKEGLALLLVEKYKDRNDKKKIDLRGASRPRTLM